jgi:hypothetical protein
MLQQLTRAALDISLIVAGGVVGLPSSAERSAERWVGTWSTALVGRPQTPPLPAPAGPPPFMASGCPAPPPAPAVTPPPGQTFARECALLAAYDSCDHLHPSDAGYKAMGDAIDVGLFRTTGVER